MKRFTYNGKNWYLPDPIPLGTYFVLRDKMLKDGIESLHNGLLPRPRTPRSLTLTIEEFESTAPGGTWWMPSLTRKVRRWLITNKIAFDNPNDVAKLEFMYL